MSKFAKGKSWIEHRLADGLALEGRAHIVKLVARKGTGFSGFRVTVVYIPHDGGADVEVELPAAATTADVHRASRELADDPARLAALYRSARGA